MDKLKNNIKGITKSKKIYFLKEWILPIIYAIAIIILINKFIFFNVYVPSESMVPTINKNDKLMILRNHSDLHCGEIIVFYSQEFSETFIKRLIGLPGDHIEIKDGIVYRNGERLKEDYVKNIDKHYNGIFDVPNDKYFFLGDNRPNSKDSRWWINPYVDKSDIEGIAFLRFYPFRDITFLKN